MKSLAIFVIMFATAVAMKLEESPPGPSEPRMQILASLERKPSQQSTGRCVEYGISYWGNEIESMGNIQHWSDCAKRCSDHRNCSYWTWNQIEKYCYLKTSDAGRVVHDNEMSGSYECLSEC